MNATEFLNEMKRLEGKVFQVLMPTGVTVMTGCNALRVCGYSDVCNPRDDAGPDDIFIQIGSNKDLEPIGTWLPAGSVKRVAYGPTWIVVTANTGAYTFQILDEDIVGDNLLTEPRDLYEALLDMYDEYKKIAEGDRILEILRGIADAK